MKFLLFTYEYPPFKGGIATYLSNLVKTAPPEIEVIVDLPKSSEHWFVSGVKMLGRVNKLRPNLFAISHVLPAGYVAYAVKLFTGVPYIVFTHGTDILSAKKSSWKNFWLKFILTNAKFVVANSRFTAGLLKEEGITKIEIIPPGVVIENNNTEQKLNFNNNLLSIGRLIPRKGFDTAIKAMVEVQKEIPDASYTIIGRGTYQAELEKLIVQRKLQGSVKILTDVADTREYLQQASIFLLPARRVGQDIEGFGIVALEASSFGLPVIVGASGGAPETIVHEVTGLVIDPNEYGALALAIISLLKNPQEMKKMGEAGRTYVQKEYSLEVLGNRFWEICQRSQ